MAYQKILLSIVIVNYNVKEHLAKCLDSIYEHVKEISFEIIIIDNNSNDGSSDLIKQKYPEILVLRNDFNAGFSAANNQGISIARGEYIFLLNPDTCMIDDSFIKMFEFLKQKGKNVLVSPRLVNTQGKIEHSAWKAIGVTDILWESVLFNQFFDNKYPVSKYISPQIIETATGAALLFSKDIIKDVGYLDDELFWSEDDDFCLRIRQNGGSIYYFPGTTIKHHGKQSSLKNMKIAYANANISKMKYYKKHHSTFKAFLAKFFTFIRITIRLFILSFLFPFKMEYRQQLFAYSYTFKIFFKYLFNEKILIR